MLLTEQQRSSPRPHPPFRAPLSPFLQRYGRNGEARDLLEQASVDSRTKLVHLDAEVLAIYTTYAKALEEDAEYSAAAAVYGKMLPLAEGNLPDDPAIATQLAVALRPRSGILTMRRPRKTPHHPLRARPDRTQ